MCFIWRKPAAGQLSGEAQGGCTPASDTETLVRMEGRMNRSKDRESLEGKLLKTPQHFRCPRSKRKRARISLFNPTITQNYRHNAGAGPDQYRTLAFTNTIHKTKSAIM